MHVFWTVQDISSMSYEQSFRWYAHWDMMYSVFCVGIVWNVSTLEYYIFEQVEPKEEIPEVKDEVKSEITVEDQAVDCQDMFGPW